MKIYTRRGDTGTTGLLGGERVPKSHPRIRAYGAVDELSSAMGWAASVVTDAEIGAHLTLLQHDLFVLGAHLAMPPSSGDRGRPETPALPASRVKQMEEWMDEAGSELPPLRAFILPGGSQGGAGVHLARTVCRRAEREVVALSEIEAVHEDVLRYLNRLADLLFVLARLENTRSGQSEVTWDKDREPVNPPHSQP